MSNSSSEARPAAPEITPSAPGTEREPNAIYQKNRLVARVSMDDLEIDSDGKEIRFGEIYQSDELVLADECEFQKFTAMIKKVAYAAMRDMADPAKGRVLRGCIAAILGPRIQA